MNKTKLTTKSGKEKAIAKKSTTSKSRPQKTSVTLPDITPSPASNKGPFPENYLPIEKTDNISSGNCPHFYNLASENQKEYVKKLIENRMIREEIDFKWTVISIAELFDFSVLKAHWASSSIQSLLKTLYQSPSVLNGLPTYERKRALESLENISSFLSHLKDTDQVLFDFAKTEDTTSIKFYEVVEMQRRHAERQVVDDGVFAFDLAFEIPFGKLNEDAKVERLKLYLKEHRGWTDEPWILPEHVKKYLPKAKQMLEAEE